MTSTERVHRYRAKLRGKAETKPETKPETKHIAALESALAQANARIAELETRNRALAAQALAFHDELQRRAAKPKPKAEKPPLPPDEARERQIKALKTRVQNLTHTLQSQVGVMPRETRIAIDKVLHPDARGNATATDKDRAVKGWNAWKNNYDKAARQWK